MNILINLCAFALSVDKETQSLQIHSYLPEQQGNLQTRHHFIKCHYHSWQQHCPVLPNTLCRPEHAGMVLYQHGYWCSCGRWLLTWRSTNTGFLFPQWLEFLYWCLLQWVLPRARSLHLHWYVLLLGIVFFNVKSVGQSFVQRHSKNVVKICACKCSIKYKCNASLAGKKFLFGK